MDMSIDIEFMAPLFELSPNAVIGAENDTVRFANPAAQALLSVRAGDAVSTCLPDYIVSDPSESFIASGMIHAKQLEVIVTRSGGFTLYTLPRPRYEHSDPMPESMLAELGSFLLTLRLALDSVIRSIGPETAPSLKTYTEVLYQCYYRMKRLHDHASMVSSLTKEQLPFNPRLLSLTEICGDVCATTDRLVADMGVSILFEAQDRLAPVTGDARLIEILLFNLLSNSLLHTPSGGAVRVSLSQQGSRCIIAVDDPGSGIPAEKISDLFSVGSETALTDSTAGAGFGLALVKGIAGIHNGIVLAESIPDHGTRIRVSLPIARPEDMLEVREPPVAYRKDGMNLALTELSVVLDKSLYTPKMFD